MVARYQSPPTWPPPPPGWVPPPGWRPDPTWGPAPEGWQFWVDDGQPGPGPAGTPQRPNRHAFRWSLLSALGWWVLLVLVLSLAFGSFAPEVAGALLGAFLFGGLTAALAVRWVSVRIPPPLYSLLVLPFVLVFRLLSVAGNGV